MLVITLTVLLIMTCICISAFVFLRMYERNKEMKAMRK